MKRKELKEIVEEGENSHVEFKRKFSTTKRSPGK